MFSLHLSLLIALYGELSVQGVLFQVTQFCICILFIYYN